MVREAKVLIEKGKIGKVEDINFEYVQDWSEGKTINKKNSRKMFRWKLDNKIVGVSTVLNELGSHACHLAGYMSGLKTKKFLLILLKYQKQLKWITTLKY